MLKKGVIDSLAFLVLCKWLRFNRYLHLRFTHSSLTISKQFHAVLEHATCRRLT